MNAISRFLGRLIIYCGYTLLIAATLTALLSDIEWLRWSGVLGLLFLVDRSLHFGKAERSLINLKIKEGEKINLAQYLTPASLSLIEKSLERALIVGSDLFLYLAKLLIKEDDVEKGLLRMDVSPQELEERLDDVIKKDSVAKNKASRPELIVKIETLLEESLFLGLKAKEKFIEPRALFSALSFIKDEKLNQVFNLFNIDQGDLENALIFSRFHRTFRWLKRLPATLGGFAHRTVGLRHRFMNRAWTARPTPTLDKYSIDFTDLAREEQIGLLIGHEKEYDRLVDVLSRATKPNALLVGEPGSGKETLVAHLAFQIIKDEVPQPLFDKRLVTLQIGNLVSGATPDELSSRVNKIIEEILSAGNIILFIPDIHNLTKTSGAAYLSAADILIPVLMRDDFPVIGATYPREFQQMIEVQSDFAGAFEVIRVEEINEDEAIKILTYDSIILGEQYKTIISFGAIKQAVVLAHKYFRQRLLPSSAQELLKESLADASQRGDKLLQADDIIAIAERKINIPIHKAGKEEARKLLSLEKIIHERLINQEEAVSAVSRALREYRSGLSRKGGPIATFLFVGPTGVGKTELAKILARIQFGSEQMMLRFDMSEYQDKQSIFRFIGSPDGKLAGNLTESVIQKPYSLILLDEFEKAHPDILNLFLQVFDDGRLTDNLSRTIDFTNTIIIATSNAHSDFIKTHIEAHTPMETISQELKKKLADYFRPELLNRFSNIIVFKTLTLDNIKAITRIQLNDLAQNVSESNGIDLEFDEAVVKKVAELGFDPVFGGRPLRGVLSEKIRGPLAEKILKGEVVKGSDVLISLDREGEFHFS